MSIWTHASRCKHCAPLNLLMGLQSIRGSLASARKHVSFCSWVRLICGAGEEATEVDVNQQPSNDRLRVRLNTSGIFAANKLQSVIACCNRQDAETINNPHLLRILIACCRLMVALTEWRLPAQTIPPCTGVQAGETLRLLPYDGQKRCTLQEWHLNTTGISSIRLH